MRLSVDGARVTLVQRTDRLVLAEDPAISVVLADAFADEAVDLLLSTPCVAIDGEAGAIRVACEGAETTELAGAHRLEVDGTTIEADQVFLNVAAEHLGELDPDEAATDHDQVLR